MTDKASPLVRLCSKKKYKKWNCHWHWTKLFVRTRVGTLGVPNCSSNICTSGWRLQPTVPVMKPTAPWEFVGVFGAPCAHHATKSVFWRTVLNDGRHILPSSLNRWTHASVAKRCPEQLSPNLEWWCPPHTAAPRLDACFPDRGAQTLLWLLHCPDLGLQFQYPLRAPGYIA